MEANQREGRGAGCGKLILFGEHTVVYGTPSIVAGLPGGAEAVALRANSTTHLEIVGPEGSSPEGEQRTRVEEAFEAILGAFESQVDTELEVRVDVDIPVGVGLGSSAALSTAVARAIADFVDLDEATEDEVVDRAVAAGERVFHGNPSGIDQLAAMEGGLHFYQSAGRSEHAPIEVEPFRVGICLAGPPASTARMVSEVADLSGREPDLFRHLKLLVGDTVRAASGAMREGDFERVGELMNVNHGALVSLGVSTADLDFACHLARSNGAYGAKLTGAGGGGCAVALIGESDGGVLDAWRSEGFEVFDVKAGGPGNSRDEQ